MIVQPIRPTIPAAASTSSPITTVVGTAIGAAGRDRVERLADRAAEHVEQQAGLQAEDDDEAAERRERQDLDRARCRSGGRRGPARKSDTSPKTIRPYMYSR